MKNKVSLLVCIICSISLGLLGFILGFFLSGKDNLNKQENNIVGTYRTTEWNESEAILKLNADNTCKYPNNNDKCEWKIEENNKVIITMPTTKFEWSYIYATPVENLTEEELEQLEDTISYSFNEVSNADYDSEKNKFTIYIEDSNNIDFVYEQLEKVDKIISMSKVYGGGTIDTTKEIEVTMVKNGLVLRDHYF